MATAERAPDRLRPAEAQGGPALRPRPGQLRRRRHAARACCTAPSCAARWRTRGSSRSTPPRRCSTRRCAPSSPARTSRALGLAWMPTLSADTQAVLATDKVRFQGQEVAFVVADDRYAARDALELIDVEYEELPVGRRRRAARSTPTRRSSATTRRARPTTTSSTGRPATRPRPTRVFARADVVVVTQEMVYPRVHPAPLETCGAVADYDPVDRQADAVVHDPGAARPPHALRDRRRPPRAQDPGHRAATSAAASATRSPIYPGYVCADRRLDRHRQAGEVDGGPLGEPDVDRVRPRLHHARARSRPTQRRAGSARLRVDVLADHGAFNATAQPTKYPAGFFHIFTGSYDLEAAHCTVTRRLHEQGARRRGLRAARSG